MPRMKEVTEGPATAGRVGARIREARLDLKLSQVDAATHLRVEQTALSRWETGKNLPAPERLPQIERDLKIPAGELIALYHGIEPAEYNPNNLADAIADLEAIRERADTVITKLRRLAAAPPQPQARPGSR